MIQLTEEMRHYVNNARENGNLCVLASASPQGTPNAGYIGTIVVLDEGSLAFRQRLPVQENIQENPKVVVLFYDHHQQVGWKFRCTASLHWKNGGDGRDGEGGDGAVFQRVMDSLVEAGLIQDPEGEGVAVVLQVDQVLTQFGELLQERTPGLRW